MIGGVRRAVADLRATILIAKARCYRAVFFGDEADGPSAEGERVLADLARYCRAQATTFDPDPHQAARLAGRREVWLRIVHYLNLDDAQVRRLAEVESDYLEGQ